jgi:hypothetical protein
MNIKIIQPAGLGDILFCQKIAKTYISLGHTVYWPIIPQYSWIKNYIEFGNLFWEDKDCDLIIDLQSAGRVYPSVPIMNAKYKMVNMDYSDWKDYMVFNRNEIKENDLYNRVVIKAPYCLVCDTFASPPGTIKRPIPPHPTLFNVNLDFIDGFTPFDWCKIIENAKELHLVDTCFIYLAEKINLKAKEMYLYSREGIFYTDHLWKKPWKYIK